jgi:hypothetical protein
MVGFPTQCGPGFGMAISPYLGILVTSNKEDNSLSVFQLPGSADGDNPKLWGVGVRRPSAGATGLPLVCTLGGPGATAPFKFRFVGGGALCGGCLAFTGTGDRGTPLLVVTDAGADTVHLVDTQHRRHAGYVAAPGSLRKPGGVAATAALVAVSGSTLDLNPYGIKLFGQVGDGRAASEWVLLRDVGGGFGGGDGQLYGPRGLRFSGDGALVCVADTLANRVSLFRVEDGSFVRHLATGLQTPRDVEECEGGWLVLYGAAPSLVHVATVGDLKDRDGPRRTPWDVKSWRGATPVEGPAALGLVPGLGLAVREDHGHQVQVLRTPPGGWASHP